MQSEILIIHCSKIPSSLFPFPFLHFTVFYFTSFFFFFFYPFLFFFALGFSYLLEISFLYFALCILCIKIIHVYFLKKCMQRFIRYTNYQKWLVFPEAVTYIFTTHYSNTLIYNKLIINLHPNVQS